MCYSLWYKAPTMLPAGGRQHRGCIIPPAVTQSSVLEDGQNNSPKHVEMTGIINIVASSWLSILFVFHYIFLRIAKPSQFIPPQNVVYFTALHFLVRKIFTFYTNDVLLIKCLFPGPKVYTRNFLF